MPIKKGGIKQRQKEMVCLGASSKGITPLLILDEGTVDHTVYIEKVFLIALRYGNESFRRDWAFQEDGARPHSHSFNTRMVSIEFSIVY